MHTPRILVVDSDRALCTWLEKQLRKNRCEAVARTDADEAFTLMASEDFDVVLTDVHAQGMGGLALCERVRLNRPDVPVVVLAAERNVATAVSAIRAGAHDFLLKPLNANAVQDCIRRTVEQRRGRRELRRLARNGERAPEGALWGTCAQLRAVHEVLSQVADSEACVLFTGEAGTGKKLAARELHARGRRRNGPFLSLNCAETPEALLEVELFGRARGAPGSPPQTGLFMQANGGTLFLDEIDALSPRLQGKLLRALQERTLRPLGGAYELPFDVRVVCATRNGLERAVAEGRFGEELSRRITVIGVELPPLRDRGDDLPMLAQRFVEHFSARAGKPILGLSEAVLQRLTEYEWPGNVRELRSCIERAVAVTSFDHLTVEDLPKQLHGYRQAVGFTFSKKASELITLEELERRYILQVMHLHNGCRQRAAESLGLDRKTLYRKLERYRVDEDVVDEEVALQPRAA